MIAKRTWDARSITQLTIAGWTGRNQDAVEKHIRELEAIGVRRPSTIPVFYRVAASLLTMNDTIEVLGDASSGEVEAILIALDSELWVGIGSDHTDRKAETIGVALSKQLCAKPASATLWRFADVAERWDDLELRSFVVIGGIRRLYQEGSLRSIRPPLELIKLATGGESLPDRSAMFCGTFAVHGALTPADRFEMELRDPLTAETITSSYATVSLPDPG